MAFGHGHPLVIIIIIIIFNYLLTYLPTYRTYQFTVWVTKVKPDINSVEIHPHLSDDGHPVDGALLGDAFTLATASHR